MRIRKRPASSQCAGATAPRSAAGVAGQISLKEGNCNPRAQSAAVADYRQLYMLSHDEPFHQVQVNIDVGSAEIACPFSSQELHIHCNDSISWQQHLQVFINKPGSRQFIGTSDALSSSHLKRLPADLLRCPIAQRQFDAECGQDADNVSITKPKERLLQTAETCLPVAADNIPQSGQGTKSSGNSHPAQIALDMNYASISSLPLLNVDLNRNLKKQASAGNIGEYSFVNASRQDTPRNFRTNLVKLQDNLYEQENVMKNDILVTDAQLYSKENNCVQDGSDLVSEEHMSCGRKSRQEWQCKNTRAQDGNSICYHFHQSKIPQNHTAWSTRKTSTTGQSSLPSQNMVDVRVLELPLFPSKHGNMQRNLQARDKFNAESGASFENIAASDSKIQRVSHSCSDDLDLKLAPKSEALPSLVETDMLMTKPESPPLENFCFKRRRVDQGVTISGIRTEAREYGHSLTEINITCAGWEHLNAVRVFGSSLISESSIMKRSTDISIVTENLDATDDGGHPNSIQEHAKSMIHDRTLIKEEPSASNDNSALQQVPRQRSTLSTAGEEETNTISASTEAKEQQQQQQCKRHDGKRWQCSRICPPGTLYCEHHARKQRRSYINQTKAERKHGVEADKAMLKLTGCLQEIHEEPSIIKVHQIKNVVKKNAVDPKLQAEIKVEVADKCKGQGRLTKRCARHDGRGWQCKSKCVAGSVYCEHHKEKLRRNHAKWNAKCIVLKQRQSTKISCGAVSKLLKEGLQELTAEDDDNQVQRKLPKEHSAIDVLEHVRPEQNIYKAATGIITAGASVEELEPGLTAVEAELDVDHREEKIRNDEASALMSSCKRKRKLLHDIYARCNASHANECQLARQ
ncbi:hypothetical protein L7F22_060590 [Adiantum nelumboides]|nr:hypothetical protein [Adiantum nelumboides]